MIEHHFPYRFDLDFDICDCYIPYTNVLVLVLTRQGAATLCDQRAFLLLNVGNAPVVTAVQGNASQPESRPTRFIYLSDSIAFLRLHC